jgi:hypothetical protein
MDNRERFCTMNDIYLFFLNRSEAYETEVEAVFHEYSYSFTEWFENKLDVYPNHLILIKSDYYSIEADKTNELQTISNYTETIPTSDNIMPNVFQYSTLFQIIKYKNTKLYSNYINYLHKVFDLFSKFDISSLLLFRFIPNNDIFWSIKLIPFIQVKNKNENPLKLNQLIKTNTKSFSIHSKKEIQKMLIMLDLENSFNSKYFKFFKDLSCNIIEQNYEFFILLFDILRDINNLHFFRNIFFLYLLSYFCDNIREIFNSNKKNIIFEDFRKYTQTDPSNILFNANKLTNLKIYSNILIIMLYKWISDIISLKFDNGSNMNNNNYNFINIGLLNFDKLGRNDLDYMKTINEILLNRISAEVGVNSGKPMFSQFIKSNFNETIANFLNDLTLANPAELKIISFCERFFDFKLLFDFYKLSYINYNFNHSFISNNISNPSSNRNSNRNSENTIKLVELVKIIMIKTYEYYEDIEARNLFVKQVWGLEFDNYERFFQYEENVFNFFQKNKFIDYVKIYRKGFYAEYTSKQFFNRYLPILEDIDCKFNSDQNYTEALKLFFKDLQSLENFQEPFEVTKSLIRINFTSYNLVGRLIKSLKEEMVIKIQTNLRRWFLINFVNYLRKSAVKIQNAWRSYIYSKVNDFDYEKCFSYIANKYKRSDPVLLKIFRNLYQNMDGLISQHESMSMELNRYKRENSELKCTISNTSLMRKRNSQQDTISELYNSKMGSQLSIKSYNSHYSNSSYRRSVEKKSNLNSSEITTSNVSIKSLMDSVEVIKA